MTPDRPPETPAPSQTNARHDPAITIASPDRDGVMLVTANGVAIGEIVKSTPRTWNITQHRPDVATFYEAINTDGEFLDPIFATAQAATSALARRASVRPNQPDHHS
jgi:hypothetical protein